MDIETFEPASGITGVRLAGRLDTGGAEQVELRLTSLVVPSARNAVVDLSGVTFIASMGLRILIATARALKLKGGKMVLFGAQGPVQGVLDDAALDQIIPIVATQEQALAALAA